MIKKSLFQQARNTNTLAWSSEAFPFQVQTFDFIENVKIRVNDNFHLSQFSIKEHYIISSNNKKQQWLSYENCQMSSVKYFVDGDSLFGIQLAYLELSLEFYGEIELLQNYMKLYTIQRDFQNKYVLTNKLGKGNFAQVYSARCKSSGDQYAVKVFEKKNFNNMVDIESLIKEVLIMRKINHKQLIKLFEVYETNNHICIIIEQMNGGTLHDFFCKSQTLTEAQSAKLIYSLLKPISHLHQLNIMHRDLKPENIIFKNKNDFEQLYIADFGLAEICNQENPKYLFTRCGTPGFVAPEVLHDKNYNCQIDVYSLGVILYGAIVGTYIHLKVVIPLR